MNEPQEKTPEDLLLVISLPRSEVRAKANSLAALHACGANYPSQERAISPAARTTSHQGGSNFACGANHPHQALKGGYFVFV